MIHLRASLLAQMQAHARSAYPHECCGLLKGRGAAPDRESQDEHIHITAVMPSVNIALAKDGTPAFDRFEVDPKVRFDLMRALDEGGNEDHRRERMIGHYHSHPDHPAQPSPRDIDMAFEPDLIWFILGVDKDGAHLPKAFRINGQTRHVETLTIAIDGD